MCSIVTVCMQNDLMIFVCYLQEFKTVKNRVLPQLREKLSHLLQIDLSCKRYFKKTFLLSIIVSSFLHVLVLWLYIFYFHNSDL